ncbi:4-(cytidine 5'-diphospho)-2-C-methyl-D-erythritol kinase [Brachyspira hampsonii]|uniref:4-diphosphocytidyl-2-C-methyl-D-erythritol kinase n=1 Tax=Brachyspira hampsonii 30446 TaxID=1289135 RepID=A0A2U4FQ08_9SPIR|nr:4-(cytidine 5'-diphospho)-2-C-methyl-D-erythritol kinase [Brachyspira hampsonii]EKV57233.1 putative 4-diphosphocytidyl-2-C-methyl-D-erythritol kinase [Brachyspira hampsonii 30446]MBW5388961.1 4-(cytidine 5'-diphospho)-2-C-methyl-D-erythritol kinase [Brachyspira hampsonii]MBW5396096.1 4-(cytidine 5'-diphospho)-2-C-methyl-D-erythritol kinase [Brachyspira hampsonii]OEJ17275.1 4-(cytidine 5'-diphospho)-2-C-methyl-D-erythritol kinase [Brachyspira hampsonii]
MPTIKAPCKINISLDITSKREDGYHLIESLFHTVSLYDIITIEKSDEYNITTSGKFALEDDKEENIVTKIFNHFKKNMDLNNNYNIHIEKNIPTGAGLGGGSSDAANIIKFFLSELNININDKLIESFSSFGADIPFFINGGCAWVSGIGEKIKNYDFILPYNIILIYPNIHVSTKLAYSKFTYDDFNKSDLFYIKNMLDNKDINFEKIVSKTYNVFEKNVFNLEKRIEEIKNKAEDIIKRKVTMSGSGSSLFALYKNDDAVIEEDFKKLKNELDMDIYILSLI